MCIFPFSSVSNSKGSIAAKFHVSRQFISLMPSHYYYMVWCVYHNIFFCGPSFTRCCCCCCWILLYWISVWKCSFFYSWNRLKIDKTIAYYTHICTQNLQRIHRLRHLRKKKNLQDFVYFCVLYFGLRCVHHKCEWFLLQKEAMIYILFVFAFVIFSLPLGNRNKIGCAHTHTHTQITNTVSERQIQISISR